MPTTNNVDNGMDYNRQHHSHAGGDHSTRGGDRQYPPHSSQTTTSKRQQSLQAPRETREGTDERRANSSAPPPFKEMGSSSTRVLSSDKGPSPNEVPGPPPAKPTKNNEPVRSGHESSERQGVGSPEGWVSVDKKDFTTTEHSDRHGARSSSRAEGAISGSQETRPKVSYAHMANPESAGSKSSGNGRSTGKEPPVQEATRSSRSGSPTKHISSNLPQGPTDPRHVQRSTQGETRTSRSDSSAKRTNEHLSDGPTDKRHGQPPTDYNARDRDRAREPSGYPKQNVVSSEEQASDSSGSSDLETIGPFAQAQMNPSDIPLPPDSNQQARSQQQQQQQQQQQAQQHQLQAAQQEDSRLSNRLWRNATSFLGGQPKDKALADAEMRIANLEADVRREQKEHARRRTRCYELENENTRLKENLQALHHELYNNQRELQEAKSLSDIRGRELQGAQVFLTKADSLSMSDVIEKVSILNEEIFQAAALFAEGIRHAKHENLAMGTIEEYQQQTCRALGQRMTQLLIDQGNHSEANSEVHPLIGQSVISGYLVYFCNLKLNSWYPSDPRISDFLSHVYGQMRLREEQAVSGRWRSLVRAQIRPSTDDWKKELFKHLGALLTISSWDAPDEAKQAFDSKVGPIFKALEDLRAAMYEKVTSVDLHAFIPEPDGPFQPWMEDAYGDDRNPRFTVDGTEIVAGTTAIGLKQTKVGREDVYTYIIPPKVFLHSTLKEALEPPPPTKGRRKRAEPQDGGRI